MIVTVLVRSDTAANLAAANEVYQRGEPILEYDTGRLKFGDGVRNYNDLPVQSFDPEAIADLTAAAVDAAAAAQAARDEAVAAAGGASLASETQVGVVEIATQAEVTTGTDTTRVVTPATLKAVINGISSTAPADATTSVKGIVRLATNAETQAGTSTAISVTPAGLAAVISGLGTGGGIDDTVYTVGSQAAMLALSATKGDLAVRTDVGKTFMLANNTPGTLANWIELPSPGLVPSVAGRVGPITLTLADTADTATRVAMTPAERTYIAGLPAIITALQAGSGGGGATVNTESMTAALTDSGLTLQAQFLNALGADDTATRALIAGILGFIPMPDTGKLIVNRDYTAANAATQTRPYGTDTTKVIVRWRATDGTTTLPTNYIAGNDEVRRVVTA